MATDLIPKRPYRDPNNKVTHTCEGPGCSNEITSYKSHLKMQIKKAKARQPGRFCSSACYHAYQKGRPRVRPIKCT